MLLVNFDNVILLARGLIMEKTLPQLKTILKDFNYDDHNIKEQLYKIIRVFEKYDQKEVVINAGLLKAGKSSLFNAVIGERIFLVDSIRATIDSEEYNAGDFLFIDTPGLDANDKDSKIAYETYKYADVIVYSHNVNEGELTRVELEEIEKIAKIFGGAKKLFRSMILVLTHSDQKEDDELEAITNKVIEQLQNKFDALPYQTFSVDSKAYLEGLEQGSDILMDSSNIAQVKVSIKNLLSEQKNNNNSLFRQYINREISQIVEKNQKIITEKRVEMTTLEKNIVKTNFSKVKKDLDSTIKNLKSKISDKRRDVKSVNRDRVYLSKPFSIGTYKSEYEASEAAKKELKKVIREAAKELTREYSFYKSECFNNANENAIYGMKNIIESELANINEKFYKEKLLDKAIKFDIVKPDNSRVERILDSFRGGSSSFREGHFNSVNYYCNRYDCNLTFDYFSTTDYVWGLFGEREKEVRHYSWDAEGAYDDILYDLKEKLDFQCGGFYDKTYELFSICEEHYTSEIDRLHHKILTEIDKVEKKEKVVQDELNKKVQALKFEISNFNKVTDLLNNLC